jgi:hypothetical protein
MSTSVLLEADSGRNSEFELGATVRRLGVPNPNWELSCVYPERARGRHERAAATEAERSAVHDAGAPERVSQPGDSRLQLVRIHRRDGADDLLLRRLIVADDAGGPAGRRLLRPGVSECRHTAGC